MRIFYLPDNKTKIRAPGFLFLTVRSLHRLLLANFFKTQKKNVHAFYPSVVI